MIYSLVVAKGRYEGKVIPIRRSLFVVGRHSSCHLRPVSREISRRHCTLRIEENAVYLKDLESTNGTYLNDQPVLGDRPLLDNDKIAVGPLLLTFRCVEQPSVNEATPYPARFDDESIESVLLNLDEDLDDESAPQTIPPLKNAQGPHMLDVEARRSEW